MNADITISYFGIIGRRMDTIQNMQVVLAIAEKGSLTAAANHLETSPPTIVRILAATEQHLGVRLFDRTTRKVRLTDEGALYVETCRHVLGEIAQVEDALRDRRTEPVGTLVITAPVLFGRLHVSPILNQFLLQNPRVTARLLLLDRVIDLIEEGIDIAIRIGPVDALDLVVTPVGSVRQCLCAAPAMLAGHPAIETPEDLIQVPFIQNLGLMPNSQFTLQSASGRHEIRPACIRLATNHADAAIPACVDGLGVGVFLSYQVEDAIAAGKLRVILPEFEPEPLAISLVYSPSRRLSARTRAFIGWAKTALGNRFPLECE